MKRLAIAVALVLAALSGAEAQPFPSRPITLIVPFPPGGFDRHGRAHHGRAHAAAARPADRDRECRGCRRLDRCRACSRAQRPMATTIDIGQWDTHVGSINLQAQLRSGEGLRSDRADLGQPAASCREEKDLAANTLPELVALMKKERGKVTLVIRTPPRMFGNSVQQQTADRSHLHSLSRGPVPR